MSDRPPEFTETVAAPGGFISSVVRAHPAEEHESKRGEVIFQEETKLTSKMDTLRQQTLAKNREFKRQCDALEVRRLRCEERLVAETEERAESFQRLRTSLEETLAEFERDYESRSSDKFRSFHSNGLDPIDEHSLQIRKAMDRYFQEEIPEAMEKQSGAATRQMLKSRESFEIDNKKLRAREAQLIARFNAHVSATSARFEAEATDRITTFTNLAEDMDATICSDNREEERIHSDTINTIASLRKIAKEETSKRATEDAEILASISRSMEKLQQQILVNFGAVDEDDY